MALKGLDIFKLSPKKNCKECGCSDMYGLLHEGCSGRCQTLTPARISQRTQRQL